MSIKILSSNKAIAILLRLVLVGILLFLTRVAGLGLIKQAAAEGLVRQTASLVGDVDNFPGYEFTLISNNCAWKIIVRCWVGQGMD